ncbi:MAG TPA: DUF748 domain-containing protein [Bacteroidales bacterium]|nr:DUF748 domain-containing protein [Bacteroidales bacterium]
MADRSEVRRDTSRVPGKRKRYLFLKILGAIVLLLIILRLLLPSMVLKYANKQLKQMAQYTGSVQDIDIHLYRGAYVAKNIVIKKIEEGSRAKDTIPLFKVSAIDLSIDWSSIFKGKIRGSITLLQPEVNILSGRHKNEDVKQDSSDFSQLLKSFMPVTVNRFEIRNGKLRYVDLGSKPRVDIAATDINLVATNLTNVVAKDQLLPATIDAYANAYGGNFRLNARFNPVKENPTFELTTELKNMNLVQLNDFMKAYGNFAVESGKFTVYAEFAGKEGNFGGYVKPFIENFNIKKIEETNGLPQRLWEFLVSTTMNILENPKTDKVATKVPIKGNFSDPSINVWRAISIILRNAFIQALRPSVENTINVNRLDDESKKSFLEKVFGSGDKSDKKKDEDKKEEKDKKEEDKKKKK